MNYKLNILIKDPTDGTEELLAYVCSFAKHPSGNENRTLLEIRGGGNRDVCDLRYGEDLSQGEEDVYLYKWARHNWSGKDGSWLATSIAIAQQDA